VNCSRGSPRSGRKQLNETRNIIKTLPPRGGGSRGISRCHLGGEIIKRRENGENMKENTARGKNEKMGSKRVK
jgi:hypothetical protein